MNDLVTSSNSSAIQAFPLSEGNVNLTSGTLTNVIGVHCVEDGSITVTWPSGDEVIECIEGQDFMIKGHSQIEISSGTFHVM